MDSVVFTGGSPTSTVSQRPSRVASMGSRCGLPRRVEGQGRRLSALEGSQRKIPHPHHPRDRWPSHVERSHHTRARGRCAAATGSQARTAPDSRSTTRMTPSPGSSIRILGRGQPTARHSNAAMAKKRPRVPGAARTEVSWSRGEDDEQAFRQRRAPQSFPADRRRRRSRSSRTGSSTRCCAPSPRPSGQTRIAVARARDEVARVRGEEKAPMGPWVCPCRARACGDPQGPERRRSE